MSHWLVSLVLCAGQVEAAPGGAALLPPLIAEIVPSQTLPAITPPPAQSPSILYPGAAPASYYRQRPAPSAGPATVVPIRIPIRADNDNGPAADMNERWTGWPDANGCCNGCCNGAYGWEPRPGFCRRLLDAYREEFKPKKDEKKDENEKDNDKDKNDKDKKNGDEKKDDKNHSEAKDHCPNGNGNDKEKKEEKEEPPRRALPAPFNSPPFPSGEYQGYPLVGVPVSTSVYPLMKALYCGPWGEEIQESRIKAYGWFTASGNWSTSQNSNLPAAYWLVPNRFHLNQGVFRLEREVDTVQTDHIDFGFRSSVLYGIDYRFLTAGGWGDEQLLRHNRLYGADPTEQFFDVYFPGIAEGMILRVGRWVSCPDIQSQFAPDSQLATHSLLFAYNMSTQTGVMATVMLDEQWSVQAGVHAGVDMAPWYQGAVPTGLLGVRWVSEDNNDSIYTVLNASNDARFRYFTVEGQPAGHDNYNCIASTWQHRFCKELQTRVEGVFMWQRDAVVGGTPSIGPVQSFGGGGGIGAPIPGATFTYGILNYTMLQTSDKSFLTVRNEWWHDEDGARSGYASNYSSHTIGLTYQFNSVLMIRPEIGFYHSYDVAAFDLGAKHNMVLYGLDLTWRF